MVYGREVPLHTRLSRKDTSRLVYSAYLWWMILPVVYLYHECAQMHTGISFTTADCLACATVWFHSQHDMVNPSVPVPLTHFMTFPPCIATIHKISSIGLLLSSFLDASLVVYFSDTGKNNIGWYLMTVLQYLPVYNIFTLSCIIHNK